MATNLQKHISSYLGFSSPDNNGNTKYDSKQA